MEQDFARQMARDQALVEEYLSGVFRTGERYADLQEAMEYSLLSGGKRGRPVLTEIRRTRCPLPAVWR